VLALGSSNKEQATTKRQERCKTRRHKINTTRQGKATQHTIRQHNVAQHTQDNTTKAKRTIDGEKDKPDKKSRTNKQTRRNANPIPIQT
jgi:hypothetical protein